MFLVGMFFLEERAEERLTCNMLQQRTVAGGGGV